MDKTFALNLFPISYDSLHSYAANKRYSYLKERIIVYTKYFSDSGTNLLFEIKTSSTSRAFNLNKIKPNHPEQEVLYKSKSCFKIMKVDEDNNIVQLEETNSNSDLTIFEGGGYFDLCYKKIDNNISFLEKMY